MLNRVGSAGIRQTVASGLQGFPLTDFDEAGEFAPGSFRERIEWMQSHRPSTLFLAGGAGEFFSLTPREYSDLVAAAVSVRSSDIPLIAATGFGTKTAIEYAQEAERLGADGLLLLPPYLTESSQAGLYEHIRAICHATGLPIIVYNRANGRLNAATLERLADACPNLIGFKDGVGDFEELVRMRAALDGRLAMINGMPTAEVYAAAYIGLGIRSYSSAVFSFCPKIAMRFYKAVAGGDAKAADVIFTAFFSDYCRLRASQPGYAVSIAKAGARITGHGAGRVRPPLSDLTPEEEARLSDLINRFDELEMGATP